MKQALAIILMFLDVSPVMARSYTVVPIEDAQGKSREHVLISARRWPPALCTLVEDKDGNSSGFSRLYGQTGPGQKATTYPIWNQDVVQREAETGQKTDVARVRRLGYFE